MIHITNKLLNINLYIDNTNANLVNCLQLKLYLHNIYKKYMLENLKLVNKKTEKELNNSDKLEGNEELIFIIVPIICSKYYHCNIHCDSDRTHI